MKIKEIGPSATSIGSTNVNSKHEIKKIAEVRFSLKV